jgi:acetyl/propionyl-CoA carboxylase alpha subunit
MAGRRSQEWAKAMAGGEHIMIYFVNVDNDSFKIDIAENSIGPIVTVNNEPIQIANMNFSGNRLTLMLDNRTYAIQVQNNGAGTICWLGSKSAVCEVIDEKTARYKHIASGNGTAKRISSLLAPMPGLIIAVEAQAGNHVKKGDGLIIMEAMKMENELRASHDCIIKEIKIVTGQTVDKGQVLVIFNEES